MAAEDSAQVPFGSDDSPVFSVAFSPDGTLVASGSEDGDIRLRDARTGQQRARLVSDSEGVWSVAFSPDGTTLLAGDADGSVRTWDVAAGQEQELITENVGLVLSVVLAPDGAALAAGVEDGWLSLWNMRIKDRVALTDDLGEAPSVAFSPDGEALAAGGSAGSIRLWREVAYARDSVSFTGHAGAVSAVAFSRDRSELITGGEDGTIRVWDVASGQGLRSFEVGQDRVQSAAVSPVAPLLAVGGYSGSVSVWDTSDGRLVATFAGHEGWVASVAFSPDGTVLVTGGGYDGTVRLWDLSVGEQRGPRGLGETSTGLRNIEQDLADATEAVEQNPGDVAARMTRAELLRDMGGLAEALAEADRAVALDPASSGPILVRARILRDLGQLDEARAAVEQVIEREPSNLDAFMERIRILYALGELDPALAEATRVAGLFPSPEAETLRLVLANERLAEGLADGQAPAASTIEALLDGGYDADDADDPSRQDALGFNDDVNMLCSVLADKKARPPLSIGLFGEWGSGKSFFMRLMRQRIERLARSAAAAEEHHLEARYCAQVRQITFNAWHYTDANLWASLAAEIFFRLATPDHDPAAAEAAAVAAQRETILGRLETSRQLAEELKQARERAQRQLEEAREQLRQAEVKRRGKAGELAQAVAGVAVDVTERLASDKELTRLRKEAADELGVPEPAVADLAGLVGDLRRLSGLAAATWRLLVKRGRTAAWALALVTVGAVALPTGLVLLAAHGSQWHGWVAIGVALSTAAGFARTVKPVLTTVISGFDAAEKALRQEEEIVRQVEAEQTKKRVMLETELERLTAREQSLALQLAAAEAAEAGASAEERELSADRRLRRFLEERSASRDYQGQLGLVSVLHKDFRRLDTLLALARTSPGTGLPRIDRIILYIDDLDRCPPTRVVEVLQAMHLLLALPLFVVVVGVDPRWLLRSLQSHYHLLLHSQDQGQSADDALSHWASTPQDYLEKIFQIPFALMPMTSSGFAQLVSDLAGEAEAVVPAGGAPEPVTPAGPARPLAPAPAPSPEPEPEPEPALAVTADGPDASASGGSPGRPARGVVELPASADEPPPSADESPARGDEPPPSGNEPPGSRDVPSPSAERISVQEGSVASAEDLIDPNPAGLRLTDHEIHFLQALAPLVTTPRAATRLINIYRMIRSTQATGGSSQFIDLRTGAGDYRPILLLLAIVSGFPDLAAPAIEALMQPGQHGTWSAFAEALPPARTGTDDGPAADWAALKAALHAVADSADVPDDLTAYRRWAPRVARFSFAAGHILGTTRPTALPASRRRASRRRASQ